jgi:hypothetical protein
MIKGADQLKRALAGLEKQFAHPLMQKVHIKAAEPLVTRMHRLSPVGNTGDLAESVGIVKLGKKVDESGAIQVGPRKGGGFKGYHGHLVEFGTKKRRTKRSGANRGIMPKFPFVERSWDQTNKEVLARIEKEQSKAVTNYLNRTVPK